MVIHIKPTSLYNLSLNFLVFREYGVILSLEVHKTNF